MCKGGAVRGVGGAEVGPAKERVSPIDQWPTGVSRNTCMLVTSCPLQDSVGGEGGEGGEGAVTGRNGKGGQRKGVGCGQLLRSTAKKRITHDWSCHPSLSKVREVITAGTQTPPWQRDRRHGVRRTARTIAATCTSTNGGVRCTCHGDGELGEHVGVGSISSVVSSGGKARVRVH